MAKFLNGSDIVIKYGTRREKNKALDALNYNVQVVKFLTKYRAVMGRSRVGMNESSTLLTEANDCFSTKINHGGSEPLTKEMLL